MEFIKDIALQIAEKLLTHEQFQSLLYYISQEGESKDFKRFYSALAEALPNYREDIMTLAQQLKQEGLQQGQHKEDLIIAKLKYIKKEKKSRKAIAIFTTQNHCFKTHLLCVEQAV